MTLAPQALRDLVRGIFERQRMSEAHAALTADVLVWADLRGMGSHGVMRVPEYVKRVRSGEMKLMGFGHRVYKNFDPRAKIIKQVADQVLEVTGKSPLLDIATELERVALQDDYFIKHRLYPNVDFYSGIIYLAIGFPVEMFPVLFAIGRTPGWLAQWQEGLLDPEQKIARPRQIYTGPAERHLPGVRAVAGTSAGSRARRPRESGCQGRAPES